MGIGVVLQILWGLLFLWIVYATLSKSSHTPAMRTVAVLVLGDIGRSPRMMYHAESFAKSGFVTVLVGYKGMYYLYLCDPANLQLMYIRC
jgi:beta-1,4-mannosyltransferase